MCCQTVYFRFTELTSHLIKIHLSQKSRYVFVRTLGCFWVQKKPWRLELYPSFYCLELHLLLLTTTTTHHVSKSKPFYKAFYQFLRFPMLVHSWLRSILRQTAFLILNFSLIPRFYHEWLSLSLILCRSVRLCIPLEKLSHSSCFRQAQTSQL